MSLISLIETRGKNIRVKRPSTKEDALGTAKKTFMNRGTMDAYVASRTSQEIFDGNRQIVQDILTVYVKGGADIEVTDRFELESVTYEITGKRTPGMREPGDRHYYHILTAISDRGT